MKKLLLFNPKATSYARNLPNSILQIAASIEGQYDYVIVDGNKEKDPLSVILNYFSNSEFGYFCSTVMPGPQLKQAIPFTKEIRARFPAMKIIWGGYFASNHSKTAIQSGYIDAIVNGPGDVAFPALLEAFEGNGSLRSIPNVVFKDNGKIVVTPKGPLLDQDTLPPLPYNTLNKFYPVETCLGKTFLGSRTISYHSSVGCPFTCSYCGVVPIYEARWKAKSAQNIYNDIKFLKDKYGGNAVQFHDNNFFVSEKRAVEFASLIRPENIKWWAEGRIDTVDKFSDESLRTLAESGCSMIFFGAESGNDALLKQMKKGGTQTGEKVKSFAARIKKFGIVPEYSFILGMPAPTEEQVWQQIKYDINFIKEIKTINPATEIIIYIYSPVPTEGSELFDGAVKHGFHFPQTLDEWADPRWINFDSHRTFLTPWLTASMIRYIHGFETVLNAQYPTMSDYKLVPFQRNFMKRLSSFRYKHNLFHFPIELRALQKFWLRYRQPEADGF